MPNNNLSLIDEYINKQQELSAVEIFAKEHAKASFPRQEKFYKSLIPSGLPNEGEQFAFEVDLDKCSGCKACVTGCHSRNGLDEEEIWREVGQLSTVQYAKKAEVSNGAFDFSYLQHITTACHHCLEPACLEGCPVIAYEKDPITGIVKHLDDQCFGCQYCTLKCPYGVPKYNKEKGIVRKCDMCTDRLKDGEAPACVQSCPNEAIQIKIVKVNDVSADAKEHFGLKNSPDADYTKPTTSYISKSKLPGNVPKEMTPKLQTQHSEWPLVVMLVFTQFSVGGALWGLASGNTNSFSQFFVVAAMFVFGAIGLAVAPLHLGRPHMMFRVVLGWRTSWLSREAMVFGGYMGTLSAWLAASSIPLLQEYLPVLKSFGKLAQMLSIPLAISSLVIGLIGVFCSAMIYKDTPREWWNHPRTIGKFMLSSFMGTALFSWVASPFSQNSIQWNAPFVVVIITSLKLFVEINTLKNNNSQSLVSLTAKIMLQLQRSKTWARFGLGALGGIILPVISMLYPPLSLPLSIVALTCLLVGELIERSQFFSASVPPRMPGL